MRSMFPCTLRKSHPCVCSAASACEAAILGAPLSDCIAVREALGHCEVSRECGRCAGSPTANALRCLYDSTPLHAVLLHRACACWRGLVVTGVHVGGPRPLAARVGEAVCQSLIRFVLPLPPRPSPQPCLPLLPSLCARRRPARTSAPRPSTPAPSPTRSREQSSCPSPSPPRSCRRAQACSRSDNNTTRRTRSRERAEGAEALA